jgi:hypothetical protein
VFLVRTSGQFNSVREQHQLQTLHTDPLHSMLSIKPIYSDFIIKKKTDLLPNAMNRDGCFCLCKSSPPQKNTGFIILYCKILLHCVDLAFYYTSFHLCATSGVVHSSSFCCKCMCVCVCVYVCIYIYIYTHTICFGLIGHLQVYNLVLQGGSYKLAGHQVIGCIWCS